VILDTVTTEAVSIMTRDEISPDHPGVGETGIVPAHALGA
jgi:hypothetical protein